jgi:protein ImuB
MSRSEAEVLAGNIPLLPADAEADRATLTELALLCHSRFSPTAALEDSDQPECLSLNIEGCAHLFRGEHGLAREVLSFFWSQNWRVRCGLSDTVGIAWALAHFGRGSVTIASAGHGEELLRPLPVSALRLPDEDLPLLAELGIERVEQLLALPRAELASRFSPLVVQRIRQALGIEPELLVPLRPSEPIVARWTTEDPISDQRILEQLCGRLLEDILTTCQQRGVGLLQCLCRFFGSGTCESYSVELVRPSNDRQHILNLLILQWEQRPLPVAVQGLSLEAIPTRRSDRSGTLFDVGHAADERAADRLVERLGSRLGKDCVLQASVFPDAQPEFSVRWRSWRDARNTPARRQTLLPEADASTTPWERPFTLLAPSLLKVWSIVPDGPPQRVEWHGQLRAVLRWWGPERIETGWWNRWQSHRDYYRVELETGEWLWIFRTEGRWHLHGLFD